MASEELTVDCIYGMGVFAMHGDASFDQYAEHFLSVVGGILGIYCASIICCYFDYH
jgi:hypothetical protein